MSLKYKNIFNYRYKKIVLVYGKTKIHLIKI